MASIVVGIGGWTFAPLRATFYPKGLPHAQELAHASRQVTSIEINGTFYRSQSAASLAAWAATVPVGFVFAVKARRGCTHGRDLTAAGPSIERTLVNLPALGQTLGAILWQFPPTKKFDPAQLSAWLDLLPDAIDGVQLRHVIEARHPTWAVPECLDLLRARGVAWAIMDSDKHVLSGDLTAPFVYARLERNAAAAPEGYDATALDAWARRFRAGADGGTVDNLPLIGAAGPAQPRDCCVYFISGDKVRAPDAARALLKRLA